MPVDLQRREVLQLGLLVLSVPLQMLLVSSPPLFSLWSPLWDHLQAVGTWLLPFSLPAGPLFTAPFPADTPHTNPPLQLAGNERENPALEILAWRFKREGQAFFASSFKPRRFRPAGLLFRVGQVVRHLRKGYEGVVVGWDLEVKAPKEWLWRQEEGVTEGPYYRILVDAKDRPRPWVTYVPQHRLRVVLDTPVSNPYLQEYFTQFDGSQYLLLPWMQVLYPHD